MADPKTLPSSLGLHTGVAPLSDRTRAILASADQHMHVSSAEQRQELAAIRAKGVVYVWYSAIDGEIIAVGAYPISYNGLEGEVLCMEFPVDKYGTMPYGIPSTMARMPSCNSHATFYAVNKIGKFYYERKQAAAATPKSWLRTLWEKYFPQP